MTKPYQKILKESADNYKFIRENIQILDDYELNDILDKLWVKKFEQDFGYYLHKDYRGDYSIDSIGFSVKDVKSYDDIVNAFNTFTKNSPLSPQETKEKNELSSLYRSYYVRWLNKKTLQLNDPFAYSNLLYLLDYVINGKLSNDLARVNKIAADNGLNYSNVKGIRRLRIKGLEPLELTWMKNGKVIIDGLSEKQYQEIERLINLISVR